MFTLGINAAFHDSAACLVRDGQIVAACEEERFTRTRHHKSPRPFEAHALPFHAIDYCLKEAGIRLRDVDHVGYSMDPRPLIKPGAPLHSFELPDRFNEFGTIFLAAVSAAPRALLSGAPHHLRERFWGEPKFQWEFLPHHLTHAASAFYPCPFERAAVLTLDGNGGTATTSYAVGNGLQLRTLGEVHLPHSLGLLYENVTQFLGFRRCSHEYKVMAMASYAQPDYLDLFLQAVQVGDNGQFTTADPQLIRQFGEPRPPGAPLEPRHYALAASLQKALEIRTLELVGWLHRTTGEQNLCLAGGVALNCVLNAVIRDRGPFQNVWVQPAANDAGTALGAALWLDAQHRSGAARPQPLEQVYLGPAYSEAEIEEALRFAKLPYKRMQDVASETAELLAQSRIVGWFQGRMEFGPRALGARSILASPIDPAMKDRLNDIKDREDFRPVAPAVLEERAGDWFENGQKSPFMLFTFGVRAEKQAVIPSVQHVDHSARIQTVNREQNALYYELLAAFEARTGVPILINTSFNSRGEPIVCTPRDALECFWTTPLDALVIGPFLLEKP